ncbi:MAG: hypothetical protein H0T65_11160, partial [Deltaproteobacteria bacterium]|nr:hypothetical protein [Deltaproteobacteria bacterium]
MGRTALYRDVEPWMPPRAEVQIDADMLWLRTPDGRIRRHALHGCEPFVVDGCYVTRDTRRFVRMLVLDNETVIITPPDRGAVAPIVVPVPEAPTSAWIIEAYAWDVLADWVCSGGRLGACSIEDLARLATISSASFASLIGEVAAQLALELAWATRGPLRGGADLESALQPFADAARTSHRAAEALISA